jgi:CrcB protein
MNAITLALCALAGGAGAGLRALLVHRLAERGGVPMWKTLLVVNAIGCAAAGAAVNALGRVDGAGTLMPLALTGLLGGFTTFSSYAVECVELWSRGARLRGVASAIGSLLACVACAWLGHALVTGVAG